jgi:hypothetical protein
MTARTRLTAFHAAIDLAKSRVSGPARQQLLIDLAEQWRDKAAAINRRAVGHDVRCTTLVDGREGVPLSAVRANGIVVHLFAVHEAAVDFTFQELLRLSPVDESKRKDDIVFKDNHLLLVNRRAVEPPLVLQPDDEVTFVNLLPYARMLERGHSKQAPNGVYETVSRIVRGKYGGIVDVVFTYLPMIDGVVVPGKAGHDPDIRYPSITLIPKDDFGGL